jgi:hypothetical protein
MRGKTDCAASDAVSYAKAVTRPAVTSLSEGAVVSSKISVVLPICFHSSANTLGSEAAELLTLAFDRTIAIEEPTQRLK